MHIINHDGTIVLDRDTIIPARLETIARRAFHVTPVQALLNQGFALQNELDALTSEELAEYNQRKG